MKPVAHIHTDLPQKFGVPRNSFLAPHLQGRIIFEPEFALDAAGSMSSRIYGCFGSSKTARRAGPRQISPQT